MCVMGASAKRHRIIYILWYRQHIVILIKVFLRSLLVCFQLFSRNSGKIIDEIIATISALSNLILFSRHVFFFKNVAFGVFYL